MPHPEAYNHVTNHPDWTRRKERLLREDKRIETHEGDGVKIFRNAVEYIKEEIENENMTS
jgi:phosphoribosylformylglycinamidine synthase